MIVGFTGTQEGLSRAQTKRLRQALTYLKPREFRHGGCVGADTEASHMANDLGRCFVIRHTPTDTRKQGASYYDVEEPPEAFLVRNRAIVAQSDVLIACPATSTEQQRSGTWATVRYARKAGKVIYIIRPDGKVEREPPKCLD